MSHATQRFRRHTPMSVLGIDVGNATSVVGLARRNGIDVVLNSESKRETPSMINFSSKQRFIGVAAGEKVSMEPKNTICQLKRLIGKRNGDAELASDAPSFNFAVQDGPEGVPVVNVQYLGEPRQFRAEQLLAALLCELKSIGEKDQGAKITDCVLGIPGFFTEQQRRAFLDAAHIAGLNILRLVHETTATALAFGIYKTDWTDKPQYFAFVDAGHSSLQVAVVSFTKSGLKVMGYGYDRNFGGRNFDEALYNHLCDEFKTKFKIDVRSNARASLRLRLACDKAKKVLSSNPETPLSIECLMNDVDVKAHLTRDLFEQLADPLLVRVLQPAQQAMAMANLSVDDIAGVEIVGGSSRLPALCKALEGFFGKTLRRTMNAAESVARGCALQGAMLSPTFHVTRRFEVEDIATYPIEFTWQQSEDDPSAGRTGSEVFTLGNTIPSAKMLTFFRSGVFPLEAHIKNSSLLSHPDDAKLADFEIGPLPAPKAGGKAKLKVKAKLNLHGCVSLDSAHIVEEVDDSESNGAGDANMDDGEAGGGAGADGEGGNTAMDTDAPKKRVVKFDVPVKQHLCGMAAQRLRELHEKELEMALQDRVMEETKERKNALEAYVLAMRTRLNEALAPYCDDATKAVFNKALQEAEDWLYDDGEDETKSAYVKRLEALKAQGDPIEELFKEDQAREPAATALRSAADQYLAACDSAQYAHIAAGQLDSIRKEAQAAQAWLQDKQAQQAGLSKSAAPAFRANDCTRKAEALDRLAKPILATPKPAPQAAQPEPTADAAMTDAEPKAVPNAEDLD